MALVELAERRPVRRSRQQGQRLLGRPRQLLGCRGFDRAPRSRARIERERDGALEQRGGGRHASARLRAAGRALQLVGHVVVGAERGLGAVPGTPVRIRVGIGGVGERPVCGAPVLGRRFLVDRRAEERMPERDAAAELEQPGADRGTERVDAEPQRRR